MRRKPKNKRSGWFRLNGKDLIKGLIVSIIGGIIDGLTTGHDFKTSAKAGLLIGGGGYLVKNVFTDHKDELKVLPKIKAMSKPFKMVILRKYGETQTIGDSIIFEGANEVFKFNTLELPWKDNERQISCIPEGDYNVEKRFSEKYGDHFIINDVTDRSYILIHYGNFKYDTKGCILPGDNLAYINTDGDLDVANSRKTMNKLNEILPNKFTLKIRSYEKE